MIAITIPGMRLPNVANARGHWSKKARFTKEQRESVALMLRGPVRAAAGLLTWAQTKGYAVQALACPVVVTITRVSPRSYDSDGTVICAKAVRDQVAIELGVNDNDPRVIWATKWRACARGGECVEIAIAPQRAKRLRRPALAEESTAVDRAVGDQ